MNDQSSQTRRRRFQPALGFFFFLAALPAAAGEAGSGVTYVKETAPGSYEVWFAEEPALAPQSVLGAATFLAIDLVGYAAKDRLRRSLPSAPPSAWPPRVRLPLLGSLYRVDTGSASSLLWVTGDRSPELLMTVGHPSDGAPATLASVHIAPDVDRLLCATRVAAGGDVFALDLSAGAQPVSLTQNIGPLDVEPDSLRLSGSAAWFVANGALYRAALDSSGAGQVALVGDLGTSYPVLPELVSSSSGNAVVAVAEAPDGKRKLWLVPAAGASVEVTSDFKEYSAPNLAHPLGPWVAVSADGSRVAYREDKDGEHEVFVAFTDLGIDPEQLTESSVFPNYIDSIGVLAFGPTGSLCFFAGDQHVSGFVVDQALGAADMYAADVSAPGLVNFVNVTKTNGDLSAPFNQLATLHFGEALVGPLGERFFLVDTNAAGADRLSCFRIDGGADPFATNNLSLAGGLIEPAELTACAAGINVLSKAASPATAFAQDPAGVACSGDPAFADSVRVLATDNADPQNPDAKVWFDGQVAINGAFDVDAATAGQNALGNQTWLHTFDLAGNLLQSVGFDSSAQETLLFGDRFGAMLLADSLGQQQALGVNLDYCDPGFKPRTLLMRYTGDDCSATQHYQDPSKVECAGDPAGAGVVHIRASDKDDPTDDNAKVWFDGLVTLDQIFAVDATLAGEAELKSTTFLHVFDLTGGLLQTVEFHTSCSQSLFPGDQFGCAQLHDCILETAPGPDGDWCAAGVKPRALTLRYNGDDCGATFHAQAPDKVDCVGATQAADLVHVVASEHSNGDGKVWFNDIVVLGGTFTISAVHAGYDNDELKNATHIGIYDLAGELLQRVEFHTSCSQPLRYGDRFGGLELLDFVLEYEPDPTDACAFGAPQRLTFTYAGFDCGPVEFGPQVLAIDPLAAPAQPGSAPPSFSFPMATTLDRPTSERNGTRTAFVATDLDGVQTLQVYDFASGSLSATTITRPLSPVLAFTECGSLVFGRASGNGAWVLILVESGTQAPVVIDAATGLICPLEY